VTDAPYPVNGGAELHVSDDCQSDTVIVIGGPPPCDCVALAAQIVPSSIKFTDPGEIGGMHLEFDVAWTMTCASGAGDCQGSITLVAPKKGKVYSSVFKKPGATITCGGDCNATTKGTKHFVLIGNRGLGGDRRGKNVAGIGIAVKRTCQGKPLGGGGFVLIFTKSTALVDKKKSKLS